MAMNKYYQNLIRLLQPSGEKAEVYPLALFKEMLDNDTTITDENRIKIILPDDGLTIISQQTGELGTYTTFSDGTVIFVPRAPVIPSYAIVSSDGSIGVEPAFDGANTTFDLSANFPAGLSVVSQLHYGAGTATTFSDGTVIYVPDAVEAAVYTHWSPDGSVIIEQDNVNKTVTYEVAKTSEPTVTEHITSVIEQAFAVDGQTEISDLEYIQRAGTIDASGAALWPIADMELMVFADASVAVALEADNPNSYSSLIHEDTLADGVFIKARLFGDILTNLPTTWKVMATGSGNVISPSHYLVHRWMGVVVPPEPLLVVGSNPEEAQTDCELNQSISFIFNTDDLQFVKTDSTDWIVEIQASGNDSKDVLTYDQFVLNGNTLTFNGWTGLSDTEYTLTLLAGSLKRSNGKVNEKFVVAFKTKYVEVVDYVLSGVNSTSGGAVTVKNANNGQVVAIVAAHDWTSLKQYLPNVVEIQHYVCYAWTGNPDYAFDVPRCEKFSGYYLLYNCPDFNQPVNLHTAVPKYNGFFWTCMRNASSNFKLESTYFNSDFSATGLYSGNSNFNQPVDFSNLVNGTQVLASAILFDHPLDFQNLINASMMPLDLPNYTSTITFGKLVVTPTYYYFMHNIGNNKTGFNVEFKQPQTATFMADRNFNTSRNCNLTLPATSAGLDLSNPAQPKWCGKVFKSITLT